MMHLYTFIVTSMKSEPYQVVRVLLQPWGTWKIFKEGKSGFDFPSKQFVKSSKCQPVCNSYNGFTIY